VSSLGESEELISSEAAPHREGSVVLHHGGEAGESAQDPDPHVGEKMPVEIIDEEATTGDAAHLRQHTDSRITVEMVKKQGGVDDVGVALVKGEGLGVTRHHLSSASELRGKGAVEVGPGVTDGDGVGVDPDHLERTVQLLSPPQEVDQVVAASAPHVD